MTKRGGVRLCGWNYDNIIGNLIKDDIQTILHGEKAESIRQMMLKGDYHTCPKDNCPYLANDDLDSILMDYEGVPEWPESLYLAYEGKCNYNCTCCTSFQHMRDAREHDYEKNLEILDERMREILPHVKTIGANGRGELFASPHLLKLLSEWKPLAPAEECHVSLETNGSLFNERNWAKISNLGQYDLSVAITLMSFNEPTYQYLSGTRLPISNMEHNLLFVKKLREEGVIDRLELATVLQEANFREMPEMTRRFLDEYGADTVRIRPIVPGGPKGPQDQWFMDVRNPDHPSYEEYRKVMSDPIFKDPRVLLWSGDLPSGRGKYPSDAYLFYRRTRHKVGQILKGKKD